MSKAKMQVVKLEDMERRADGTDKQKEILQEGIKQTKRAAKKPQTVTIRDEKDQRIIELKMRRMKRAMGKAFRNANEEFA